MKTFISCLVALCAATAFAGRGVDVSSNLYESSWTCLQENGYDYGIVRAYMSSGYPDPAAVHSIYNFWDSGMASHGGKVGVYLFPDVHVDDPASQVSGLVAALKNANIHYSPSGGKYSYDRVWLDIEIYAWHSVSENIRFIEGLIQGCKNNGVACGIYTNENNWSTIAGDWTGASDLPLWYAHYDGVEACSDFRPFGGWSRPAKKQWRGDATVCSASVDLNVDC